MSTRTSPALLCFFSSANSESYNKFARRQTGSHEEQKQRSSTSLRLNFWGGRRARTSWIFKNETHLEATSGQRPIRCQYVHDMVLSLIEKPTCLQRGNWIISKNMCPYNIYSYIIAAISYSSSSIHLDKAKGRETSNRSQQSPPDSLCVCVSPKINGCTYIAEWRIMTNHILEHHPKTYSVIALARAKLRGCVNLWFQNLPAAMA